MSNEFAEVLLAALDDQFAKSVWSIGLAASPIALIFTFSRMVFQDRVSKVIATLVVIASSYSTVCAFAISESVGSNIKSVQNQLVLSKSPAGYYGYDEGNGPVVEKRDDAVVDKIAFNFVFHAGNIERNWWVHPFYPLLNSAAFVGLFALLVWGIWFDDKADKRQSLETVRQPISRSTKPRGKKS